LRGPLSAFCLRAKSRVKQTCICTYWSKNISLSTAIPDKRPLVGLTPGTGNKPSAMWGPWKPQSHRPRSPTSKSMPLLLLGAGGGPPAWYGLDAKKPGGALGEPEAASLSNLLFRRRSISVQPLVGCTCDADTIPPRETGRVKLRWRNDGGKDDDEDKKEGNEAKKEMAAISAKTKIKYKSNLGKPANDTEITNSPKASLASVANEDSKQSLGASITEGKRDISFPDALRLWTDELWRRVQRVENSAVANTAAAAKAAKRQLFTGSVDLWRSNSGDQVEVQGMHRGGTQLLLKASRGGMQSYLAKLPSGELTEIDLLPGGPHSLRLAGRGATIRFRVRKLPPQESVSASTDSAESGPKTLNEKGRQRGVTSNMSEFERVPGSRREPVKVAAPVRKVPAGHVLIPQSAWCLSASPAIQVAVPLGGKAELVLEPDGSHSTKLTAPSGASASLSLAAVSSGFSNQDSIFSTSTLLPEPRNPLSVPRRAAPTVRLQSPSSPAGSVTSITYSGGMNGLISHTAVLRNQSLTLTGIAGLSGASASAIVKCGWGSATANATAGKPANVSVALNLPTGSASAMWTGPIRLTASGESKGMGGAEWNPISHVFSVRIAHYY
jgi:hypothetical protein